MDFVQFQNIISDDPEIVYISGIPKRDFQIGLEIPNIVNNTHLPAHAPLDHLCHEYS